MQGIDDGKAYSVHPELYQLYSRGPGYENGYHYYISSDDKWAIYRSKDRKDWVVGSKSEL